VGKDKDLMGVKNSRPGFLHGKPAVFLHKIFQLKQKNAPIFCFSNNFLLLHAKVLSDIYSLF